LLLSAAAGGALAAHLADDIVRIKPQGTKDHRRHDPDDDQIEEASPDNVRLHDLLSCHQALGVLGRAMAIAHVCNAFTTTGAIGGLKLAPAHFDVKPSASEY
jgi:hypothetical protein